MSALTPEKALIFRITHIANIPWLLDNGIHCRNSPCFDPAFRSIGNPEVIQLRQRRVVSVSPGGPLSDYVPFYFTPFSIMMYNIHTGYGEIPRIPNDQIVILVSSLRRAVELKLLFVFTNQHACLIDTEFFNDMKDLNRIDWTILQNRDFKHDPDKDPKKKERYQAEALVHKLVPLDALLGIGCHSPEVESCLKNELARRKLNIRTVVQPNWYFHR
jgi:hypothetical protein